MKVYILKYASHTKCMSNLYIGTKFCISNKTIVNFIMFTVLVLPLSLKLASKTNHSILLRLTDYIKSLVGILIKRFI